jgi:hypothetical protein
MWDPTVLNLSAPFQLGGKHNTRLAGLIMGYIGTAWSVVIIALMIGLIGATQSMAPFIYTLF